MYVNLCSKLPYQTEIYYYQTPAKAILHEDYAKYTETQGRPVIFASNDEFNVATTHFTWNPEGQSYFKPQADSLEKMLQYLEDKPPHILCGDMNIPRKLNPLYSTLVENYMDSIPSEYRSSLDANLHRCGDNPALQHLFASFMVDYLLTQPPYQATDVRLEFGVSDHAAVVATIQRHT